MTTTPVAFEDISTEDLFSAYSDCYKSLNGFRPRMTTREDMKAFFESYDERFEEEEENERHALARRSEECGVEFKTWHEFYAYEDAKSYAAYETQQRAEYEHLEEQADNDAALAIQDLQFRLEKTR